VGSTWTQGGAKLTGGGESGSGGFGGSVALSGDGSTALIGGPYDNGVGAAWAFTRAGSTWTQGGAKLTGGGESGSGGFGWSVALSGDGSTALIGGGCGCSVGGAWVFTRAGSTFTQQGAKLTGAGESGPGDFGESVAVSGDGSTALVGGPYDNHDIGVQPAAIGAAWVFSAAAPSVSIRVPADGARYAIGEIVTASYSCQDGVGGPGIASCTGTVQNGARIDTARLGSHTLTVTATSVDGQHTSQTVSYSVVLGAPNGLLVAAPLDGHGLALIDPRTGSNKRICTDRTLCGRPVQPRWSPNGLAIAFTNTVGARVGILTADGTCLWCMLGAPLSNLAGSDPAFASGGKAVTFVSGRPGSARGLWQVGLGSAAAHRLLRGAYADAVWSSTGKLAVVHSGSVWVGGVGRRRLQLRLLARGTAPAWSPDGSRLALVRGGWVWVVRIRDGSSRRLARGSSPSWSPDGSDIAYIGRSHLIYVVNAGGGRSRRVGEISVRSIDWQPQLRPAARSCTPGKGSTVIASSAQAVITSSVETTPAVENISWYGCLRALGHKWMLNSQALAPGYDVSLTGVAEAGRFAVLEFNFQDHYDDCSNSVTVYDLSNGKPTPVVSYDCTPGDAYSGTWVDSLSLSASGFSAWRATQLRTCAAATTCIAAQIYAHDDHGTQLLDSAPLGSASPQVPANPLANLNLSGNVLTWTHDGTQHQITLE
jgi:Tol biopolymer transport system component